MPPHNHLLRAPSPLAESHLPFKINPVVASSSPCLLPQAPVSAPMVALGTLTLLLPLPSCVVILCPSCSSCRGSCRTGIVFLCIITWPRARRRVGACYILVEGTRRVGSTGVSYPVTNQFRSPCLGPVCRVRGYMSLAQSPPQLGLVGEVPGQSNVEGVL